MTEEADQKKDKLSDTEDKKEQDDTEKSVVKEKSEEASKECESHHQNGSIRLRKTKRGFTNKPDNTKNTNGLKKPPKLFPASPSKTNPKSSFGQSVKLNLLKICSRYGVLIAFVVVVILTLATRLYKLDDPKHIW